MKNSGLSVLLSVRRLQLELGLVKGL